MALKVKAAGIAIGFGTVVVTCVIGVILFRKWRRHRQSTSMTIVGRRGGMSAEEKGLKDVITWVFESLPDLVQEWKEIWTKSLNQRAKQSPLNLQIRFQQLRNINVPPQLSNLSTEYFISDSSLMIRGDILWKQFELILIITPRAAAEAGRSVCSIDCQVLVFDFQGKVEGMLQSTSDSSRLLVRFIGEPVMKLDVKPHHEAVVHIESLERLIRETVSETEVQLPIWNRSSRTNELDRFESQPSKSIATNIECLSRNITGEKRKVLVKIIKANGLIASQESDYGSQQPFCVALMDNPVQRYVTSSVKNSANPFFDEQFVFDFDETTKKITFEVHDKEKPESDDFLGMTFITADDFVQRTRHVLPLTGKGPMTFGALTVEASIVEPGQLSSVLSLSPNVLHMQPSGETVVNKISNNRQVAALNPGVVGETGSHLSPTVTVSQPDITSPSQLTQIGTDVGESSSLSRFATLPPKSEVKKKRSFVGNIKKRFQRKSHDDVRSKSAERSAYKSPSVGEGIYLTPPASRASANIDYDESLVDSGQRSRSNSVRANLRRLFGRKRTPEDSPTRLSNRGINPSPEGSTGQPSPRHLRSSSATRERQPSAQLTTSSLYEQSQ